MKKDGPVEAIGGISTIANLTYGLPHFSNLEEYVRVVKDKSVVRTLIRTCNQITSEALAEEDDAAVILDRAEQMVFAWPRKEHERDFFMSSRSLAMFCKRSPNLPMANHTR